jgi:Resolvase, N terminal domain
LKRPVVQEALRTLGAGEASALVVVDLDRLSRSPCDFAALMAKAQKEHRALVALDVAVDTSTPADEALVNMLATFAQFERRLIGQRTREALQVKKAQGVKLGRPASIPATLAMRIVHMRERGMTLQAICDRLNADGIPLTSDGVSSSSRVAKMPSEATSPGLETDLHAHHCGVLQLSADGARVAAVGRNEDATTSAACRVAIGHGAEARGSSSAVRVETRAAA